VTIMLRVNATLPWVAGPASNGAYSSVDYDVTLQAFLFSVDPVT